MLKSVPWSGGFVLSLSGFAGAAFTPGDVFYAAIATPGPIYNITGGGDFTGTTPFAHTPAYNAGQMTWSADLSTMYASQLVSDSIVAVTDSGVVTTFATGIDVATGVVRLQDGRLLAVANGPDRVYDITAGGHFTAATPFATGLDGPRSLLETSDGRILVVNSGNGRVIDITAGGNFAGATPFASGLGAIGDIVQDASGRIFVARFGSLQVMDITAGGNFQLATPFATGQQFMGLTIDGSGRLLANELATGHVWDITAGGDFSAAPTFATGLGHGETAFDTVPVPEPGGFVVVALAALGLRRCGRSRRGLQFVRPSTVPPRAGGRA